MDDLEEECNHLIGSSFKFTLKVGKLKRLDVNNWCNPHVEFQCYMQDKKAIMPKIQKPKPPPPKKRGLFSSSKKEKQPKIPKS